ncbi:MAG TPA: polysaccharide pyruvyl transferase family protein [Burkholderiales bacterium]|nr:polysaccharide pyruvyl transferase family protein [Burkholderiales bacterium]
MQLHYCEHLANFGDRINPWLWSRLIPDLLDADGQTLLLGVGTILSDRVPARQRKVVFGSGIGYGPPPQLDENWNFYSVRGPLTAHALGLPARAAITDPAALVGALQYSEGLRDGHRESRPAFMPHHLSARCYNWRAVARQADMDYIDPCDSVPSVINRIFHARLLVTESLHGAIVADALRVPWIPVCAYSRHVLDFKWRDWCASLGLAYRPVELPALWDAGYRGSALVTRARLAAKRWCVARGFRYRTWSPPRPLYSPAQDAETAVFRLQTLAGGNAAGLSRDEILDSAIDRLLCTLEKLRREETTVKPCLQPEPAAGASVSDRKRPAQGSRIHWCFPSPAAR